MDGNSPCDSDRRLPLRQRLSPRCEEGYRVINPGSSLSSLKKFLDSIALHGSATAAASPSSAQAVAHDTNVISPQSRRCLSSTILVRRLPDWGLTFYIRVDSGGDFHPYPHLGGPFQSLQEANIAIDCHLDDRKDTMFKKQEGVSPVELAIRSSLYWLDGTRKKCSKSEIVKRNLERIHLLVQALVDKYNEDHNLLEDLAYELKDVLHYQFISETHISIPKRSKYYHLNFTMKTKGADDFVCGTDDLFFVEIKLMQGEHEELAVCRFCIVKPNDNGHCYGCTNNGSAGMKHPNNSYAYVGGHVNAYLPFEWSDSEDNVDEEARIRHIYKGGNRPLEFGNTVESENNSGEDQCSKPSLGSKLVGSDTDKKRDHHSSSSEDILNDAEISTGYASSSCNNSFYSYMALQSHFKARHGSVIMRQTNPGQASNRLLRFIGLGNDPKILKEV